MVVHNAHIGCVSDWLCVSLVCWQDKLLVRGSVYFPNLTFEYDSLLVDFGCILNNLEDVRYLTMTNLSPMVVNYRWSFEVNAPNGQVAIFHTDPGSYSPPPEQTSDLVSDRVRIDGVQPQLWSWPAVHLWGLEEPSQYLLYHVLVSICNQVRCFNLCYDICYL